MEVGVSLSVSGLMALSTKAHEVTDYILALTPARDMMDVYTPLTAVFAWHERVDTKARTG